MTIDIKKEKKAAADYLNIIAAKNKNSIGVDIGINKEVKTSQIKTLSPQEKLKNYLKSIEKQ
jgi:hypothetical protein